MRCLAKHRRRISKTTYPRAILAFKRLLDAAVKNQRLILGRTTPLWFRRASEARRVQIRGGIIVHSKRRLSEEPAQCA